MDFDSMKVDELKSELKRRGCAPSELKGKKAELLAKLIDLVASTTPPQSTAQEETPHAAKHADISNGTTTDIAASATEIETMPAAEECPCDIVKDPAEVPEHPTSLEPKKPLDGKSKAERMAELKAKTAKVAQEALLQRQQQQQQHISEPVNKRSCNIRIDNFIRPLTHKGLVQWLQEKLGPSAVLAMNDVWVNGIKTHCYVTLPSEEIAAALLTKVNGSLWLEGTSGGGSTLSADFSQISAHMADRSREAKLHPGEWKLSLAQNEASDLEPLEPILEAAAPPSSSIPTVRGRGAVAGIAGVLIKAVAASARDVPIVPAIVTTLASQHTRQYASTDKREREEKELSEVPAKKAALSKPLDEIFRKTQTKPHLFWLPRDYT